MSGIVLFNGPIKVSIVLLPLQFTMKYIVKAVDLSLNIDLQKREHGHASNDKKLVQRECKLFFWFAKLLE